MTKWTRVKWTEAGQVTTLLAWDDAGAEPSKLSPEAFFRDLRAQGRMDEAAMFLGQALPRFEAVAWAAKAVKQSPPKARQAGGAAEAAMAAVAAWLNDPSETNRRAAFEASTAMDDANPERLAALAVFFSGGSMAPGDCPPVPAPREAAGKFASAAVILAASRTNARQAALAKALDLGETFAAERGPLSGE